MPSETVMVSANPLLYVMALVVPSVKLTPVTKPFVYEIVGKLSVSGTVSLLIR